ncbi:MAG: acyltransferase, partial [Nitrosomonadales bacterium]|nr:acyltransferase [Nitrosomonadales bacterium]
RTRKFSYPHYLLRRFARIFPMYCVAIVAFWWLGGNNYYQNMFGVSSRDIFDLFAHLTFLNLWDVRYQASVIGVEWTVPIEMWTYLIIPPLFFFLARIDSLWKWIVFFVALALSLLDPRWHQEWLGAHWAIETYLYCFIGGIIAYSYLDRINLSAKIADSLVVAILIGALFPPGGGRVLELWYTVLVMALILVLSQARYMRPLFENRPVALIGNISFSFYLLHFPILHYLTEQHFSDQMIMLIGMFSTTSIAYLCHILIEKPALKMTGKRYSYDP